MTVLLNQQAPALETAKAAAAREPRRRMSYIDILRAIACLWVVLYHCMQRTADAPSHAPWIAHAVVRSLASVAGLGWVGVGLFLVLSGFCLYYPLVRATDVSHVRLNLPQFARRRAMRILPPYYASIIISTLVNIAILKYTHRSLSHLFAGWYDLPAHLLMLHNLTIPTFHSINGVYWSLALECQLYLVFPILIWVAARYGLRADLIAALCLSLLWTYAAYTRLGFSFDVQAPAEVWYNALPARCFEFVAGMTAAAVVARSKAHHWKYALIILVAALIPSVWYASDVSRLGPGLDPLWGCVFASAIVALHAVPEEFMLRNGLMRWLTWLGAISYSVYLVHAPILTFTFIVAARYGSHVGLITFPFIFVASIVCGYGFHLLFERPFMPGHPRTTRQVEVAAAESPAP